MEYYSIKPLHSVINIFTQCDVVDFLSEYFTPKSSGTPCTVLRAPLNVQYGLDIFCILQILFAASKFDFALNISLCHCSLINIICHHLSGIYTFLVSIQKILSLLFFLIHLSSLRPLFLFFPMGISLSVSNYDVGNLVSTSPTKPA